MKFGGTSVGSAERIAAAAQLVSRSVGQGHRVVAVTSAMSGVTNGLIDAARAASKGHWDPKLRTEMLERHQAVAEALIPDGTRRAAALADIDRRLDRFEKLCFGLSMVHELTPRLLDAISGTGEMLAAPLVAAAIEAAGHPSSSVDATDVVVTTDQFGGAEPLMEETRARADARLRPLIDRGDIPVVTGFIGATVDGVLTTLGRGGSDYSASILGAALDADEVWIWTDVDGVLTANPSEVRGARTLSEISYSEASELAYYGAKVLHYKTILPAFRKRIPVRILNSFNPSHPGTRVTVEGDAGALGVKAVTSIRGVSLIAISGTGMQGIPGIVAKTFDVVAEEQSNVLMISQASSENNICFVISSAEAPQVVKALRRALEVELMRGHIEEIAAQPVAVVAAIGDRMRGTPGVAATVFGALGTHGINVIAISQGSSERNISLVVAEADAAGAVRALHDAFQLERAATRGGGEGGTIAAGRRSDRTTEGSFPRGVPGP